jgi:ribonuclease M5
MITITETIVVEGRADEQAVKRAVHAEVIVTSGYKITADTFQRIAHAQAHHGVIVLTDPDPAGQAIRRRINARVTGCQNAHLARADARKRDNIGVEHAAPQRIVDALKRARCSECRRPRRFSAADLFANNLMGGWKAAVRRRVLGRLLGIGYANGKQFVTRLNVYGVRRDEFDRALSKMSNPLAANLSQCA